MRVSLALLPLLLSPAVAEAGPVTKLPPPKPEWVTVQADPVQTTLALDKPATWALLDAGPTADLRPSADGKTAVFAAVAPGRYRVVAAAEK